MAASIAAAGAYVAANAGTVAAVASTAAAAASAAVSYKQGQDQKSSQEAYNKALEKDAIRQYGELDKVEADAIQESHAQSLQAQREYLTAKSQVELQAAATGTYGGSVAASIQDLNTGFGGRMAEITYERESRLDEINRKAEAIQRSPSMNADTTIQMPSYYSAGVAAINTFDSVHSTTGKVINAYQSAKPAKKVAKEQAKKTAK